MPLDNSKRCGRLFQKTISSLCGGCYHYEQDQHMEIYRFIQDNPGTTMDEISRKFNIPQKDIEGLVFSGALGTANLLIKSHCSMCKCEMTFANRVGHFCYKCNALVEKEAGLGKSNETEKRLENVKNGKSAFYKPDEEEPKAPPKEKAAPPPSPKNTESEKPQTRAQSSSVARFGFKRMSGEFKRERR